MPDDRFPPPRGTLSNPVLQAHLDAIAALPTERLPLSDDAQRLRPGIRSGTVHKHVWRSQIYPGTTRDIRIYLPVEHERTSPPARTMVFQDGHAYADPDGDVRATMVLDNLIGAGELPPIVGIFIDPGALPPATEGGEWIANRSFEYNTISDQYVRFLTDEVLPFAAAQASLSERAEHRAICGASSGGIAAFLAAWYRPDVFSKVLSHVGSFTDILGGHHVQSLVRKHPRKPLRIFLQGCSHDLDQRNGDWWLANLELGSALRFAGYDFEVAWTAGEHSYVNGGAILPQSLRWLWRE
jgi:enterochelin esterase family protein